MSLIDQSKRVTFSLGFLLAMIGAVSTATHIYGRLSSDNQFLKDEVGALKVSNRTQADGLSELKMELRLFIQKYDQDMNRYIRDRRETTVRQ